MTVQDLQSLFVQISESRTKKLRTYLKHMREYYPELLDHNSRLQNPTSFRDYTSLSNAYRNTMIFKHDTPPHAIVFMDEFLKTLRIYVQIHSLLFSSNYRRRNAMIKSYIDSPTIRFEDDDVLITDPCFIIPEDLEGGWYRCGYGVDFEAFGMDHYITRSTLSGDWDCTLYDDFTHEKIGHFSAGAGLVSIFSLSDVRKFVNLDITQWIESHPTCAAIIPNFTGSIQIKTAFNDFDYFFYTYIEGRGSLNFYSKQDVHY